MRIFQSTHLIKSYSLVSVVWIHILFIALFPLNVFEVVQGSDYQVVSENCEITFISADMSPTTQSNYNRIMIADINTSDLLRLSDEHGVMPTWSPDGQRIAFVSVGDPNHLYIINRDGSDLHSIAQHVYWRNSLSWSPDGKSISYISDRTFEVDGYSKLYVVSLDDGSVKQLSDRAGYYEDPVWSPDSTQIAFVVSLENETAIYTANVHDGEHQMLVEGVGYGHPDWSPDGKRIAFSVENKEDDAQLIHVGSTIEPILAGGTSLHMSSFGKQLPDAEGRSIHVIDADSTNEQVIVEGDRFNIIPKWSPDSSRLLFISSRENDQLHVINADGSDLQVLVDLDLDYIRSPEWSPDGRHIAFIAATLTGDDIWILDVDTLNLMNLGYAAYQQVKWSPQCKMAN